MSEPIRIREVVVLPRGQMPLMEGEDFSRLNRLLLQLQQTAKSPHAGTTAPPTTTTPKTGQK